MKRCQRCSVFIPACRERCPLCQGSLSPLEPGQSSPGPGLDQEVFPQLPTLYRKHNLFFRILIFLSILGGTVAVVLNILLFRQGLWSLFVLAGIGCGWFAILVGTRRRSSFSKWLLYDVVALSLILLFVDWLTGWNLWAVDYAIPGLCVMGMAVITTIALVMYRRIQDYIIYLVVNAGFGLVPLVFILTGLADVIWPSVLCIALNLLLLSGLVLFAGKDTRTELKKRLHL